METIDRQLLSLLAVDGRMSFTDLGRESAGEGEGKVHDAHGPAAAQRMFRRKSGG